MKAKGAVFFSEIVVLFGGVFSCSIGWAWLFFFKRTVVGELVVGLTLLLASLGYWFLKKPARESCQSPFLWFLCIPPLFLYLLFFTLSIGKLHSSSVMVLTAASIGIFEETCFRIIPLLVFYTHQKRLRQLSIWLSSILFGLAHVVGFLNYLHSNVWFWLQFILKAVSAGSFGFCLAILIVNYKTLGSLVAILVHSVYDWMGYAMFGMGKVSYISTNTTTAVKYIMATLLLALTTIALASLIYYEYNQVKTSLKSGRNVHLSFWGYTLR